MTLWYLLIITLITVLFSVVIYKGLTQEFDRVVRLQRYRMEHPNQPIRILINGLPANIAQPRIVDTQLIEDAESRIRLIIILLDLGILLASAIAGYFLAGRTLKPIEQMLEEQKRFTADASHELRTPLAALKSEIEVSLRDKNLTLNQAKKLLHSNLEEVDKLESLSDYLLSLARFQGMGTRLNFDQIKFESVISQAKMRVEPLAKKKNIKINVKTDDTTLPGNERSLIEAVTVLLDNAIKFSPKGSEVLIKAKTFGNNLQIDVEDQGIGIAEKDLAFIFSRFYQADKSRTNNQGGFGLGLSIAKRIIELHRGTITVSSKVGEGTIFTIKIPLKQSPALLKNLSGLS